jgi:hypothetical protein
LISFLSNFFILNQCNLIYQLGIGPENMKDGQIYQLAIMLLQVFVEEMTGYVYGNLLGGDIIRLKSYGFEPSGILLRV